jgi:hypothetical protein
MTKKITKTATKPQTEITYNYIKVSIDSKNLIERVEITENQFNENPDIYFVNTIQAQQYAKNELLSIKDKYDWNNYNELICQINNFV